MNIYEIQCNGYRARTKAASFATALSRGMKTIKRMAKKLDKQREVNVRCFVLHYDVAKDCPVPPFEKEPAK